MQYLLLSENVLSGTLSRAFGALPSLRSLHLTRNPDVGGTLPPAYVSGHALEDLQLSSTRLSGSLPSALGSLTYLQHMLVDQAGLSGTIPSELGACGDLAMLSLEFNRLSVRNVLPLSRSSQHCWSHAHLTLSRSHNNSPLDT